MNKERLAMVRDAIAANPDGYDQVAWLHSCGTPSCVAGWAAYLSLEEDETLCIVTRDQKAYAHVMRGSLMGEYAIVDDVRVRAVNWLELNASQSDGMFMPFPFGEDGVRSPSPNEAVAMLGHAIETGEVLWLEDA